MRKLCVVRLTDHERDELYGVVKKLKGTGQKVRRAQILLKADADGPNWTDERIAEAFLCRTRTVERLRQRFVEQGFDVAADQWAGVLAPARTPVTVIGRLNAGIAAVMSDSDVRARLAVLSELPAAWRAATARWCARAEAGWGSAAPDRVFLAQRAADGDDGTAALTTAALHASGFGRRDATEHLAQLALELEPGAARTNSAAWRDRPAWAPVLGF